MLLKLLHAIMPVVRLDSGHCIPTKMDALFQLLPYHLRGRLKTRRRLQRLLHSMIPKPARFCDG